MSEDMYSGLKTSTIRCVAEEERHSASGRSGMEKRKQKRWTWLIAVFVLLGAVAGQAGTITVDAGGGADYTTIQGAMDAASPGDTIVIAAGTYIENPVIVKRLHLIGAGDDAAGTIIQGDPSGTTVVRVFVGGTSAAERLILEGIRVTGGNAATPGGNIGAGIELATGVGHVLLSHVTSTGNDGHGFDFNATAAVADVHLEHCTLVGNKGAGVRIPQSLPSLIGFSLTDSTIAGNEGIGVLLYSTGVTDVLIANCSFEGNNSSGATGGDLVLSGFTGDGVFENLTFNSIDADSTIRMSGTKNSDKTPKAPAGHVEFRHVTIAGTQAGTYPGAAIAISRYTDASNISFENVVLASSGPFGMHLGTLNGTMNLGGVTFDGSYTAGDLYLGQHGEQSGTSNTYPVATVQVDARAAVFAATSDPFAIEDLVHHALDESGLGRVMWTPNNVYVTPSSGSIQRGIDTASDGWTVNIAAGTYDEHLTVTKPLTIQGDLSGPRPEISTLSGATAPLMTIQASDVTIAHLHFYKATTDDPDWTGNSLVVIPRAGGWGSYYIGYSNVHLDGNTLQGGRYAMFVCANDLTIENSQFLEQGSTSIDLTSVSGTTNILNNTFDGLSGSKKAVMAENLSSADPATSGTINVEGNTVNDKREFFLYNQWIDPSQKVDIYVTNNTIISTTGDGVVIYDPREYVPDFNTALFAKINSVTVQDNDLSGVPAGRCAVKTVVDDDDPVLVDATNNWWGDPSGPYHPTSWTYDSQVITNPDGKGDEVSDYVLYEPWYCPSTPMTSFVVTHAKIDFKAKPNDDKARVQGTLELDLVNGNDVNVAEEILVTVGPLSEIVIMVENGKKGDRWEYKRPKGGTGVIKDLTIDWKNGRFDLHLDKADLTGLTNPLLIGLRIGDDVGSVSISMSEKKSHWDYTVNRPKALEAAPMVTTDPLRVVAYPNPIRDVNTATFQAMGALVDEVEEIRVAIFDLSGHLVWEDAAAGSELDWHTDNLSGDYLANGVYLYRVLAKVNGSWIVQEMGKIAVLR